MKRHALLAFSLGVTATMIGLLPVLSGPSYADEAQVPAQAATAIGVAQAALDRAVAVGGDNVVPRQSLSGVAAGDLYLVRDPQTLGIVFGLVTLRRPDGAVAGVIGLDAGLDRAIWYSFSYQFSVFPPVSSQSALSAAKARARSLGEVEPAGEGMLVGGYDEHLYWRFESEGGEASFVDAGRPGSEAVGTSDNSARRILTPAATERVNTERIRMGQSMGNNSGFAPRPPAYNMAGIPYHYQITSYNCGPASLEMTMDYAGEEIAQAAVAQVANTLSGPGTYNDDLRRAAHFSGMSTAVQNPLLVGYVDRQLGYSAEEYWWGYLTLPDRYEDPKVLAYAGYPVLILTWFDQLHGSGHFRVIKGYDDNLSVFVVHDPWFYGFSGPDLLIDQTYLVEDLWAYSWWWGMISGPWILNPDVPSSVAVGDTFAVHLKIRYPGPDPFAAQYACSGCNATITLPAGLALAGGSGTVALPNLDAGDSTTVTWNVVAAGAPGDWGMAFQAQGTVSGSSGAYPSYTDSIGGHSYETVRVAEPSLADWQAEERLTNDAGSSATAWPGSRAMVMDEDGNVHLVWADTRDGNSEIYYRERSGGTWGAEVRLTNDPALSDGPCITEDPIGRLHVAWVDTRDGNQEIYYKYYDSSTGWSADERVTTYGEADHGPTIAASGSEVYLVWQERETGGGLHYYYLMFSARTGAGWSTPIDVDVSPERDCYRPSAAWGSDGLLHLVYERQSANASNELERIAYSNWNGTAWSTRIMLSTALSYSRGPVIAAASDGTLHVVWQDGENTGGDIFYVEYNGSAWQPVEEIVTGGSDATTPSVAVAGGGVYVAWADHRQGEPEVYFMAKDGLAWSEQARLSRAPGGSMLPCVAANSLGNPCVVWTDLRDGNSEIYFRASSDLSGVPPVTQRPAEAAAVRMGRPYPEPSLSDTKVTLAVERTSQVAIEIFDVQGNLVRAVDRATYEPGVYTVSWNGENTRGSRVGPGIYFIRCRTGGAQQVERIVLVR